MFARHFCLSLRDPLPTSSLSVMRLLGLIAGRFYVLVWLTVRSDSGGRRMYRSRFPRLVVRLLLHHLSLLHQLPP